MPATPLAEKLGLKRGMRCWFHDMPADVRVAIDPEAAEIEEQPSASDGLQCAMLFGDDAAKLERTLAALRPLIAANGMIWVLWQDGVLTESGIRALATPDEAADAAIVDAADWSGLGFTIRK